MLHYLRMRIQSMTRTERGASAVEYGLLVALIALAIIGGAIALGTSLDTMFDDASTCVETPDAATC
jgi:pilus assembly protein Flp/PilA